MKRLGIVVLACALARLAHADAKLHSDDLVDLLKRADLVLEGTVIDVQYKSSSPASPRDRPLPHTFVTYQIRQVLKPRAPLPASSGNTITLRFLGGAAPDGRTLWVSGYPLFDLGDEDVLLVEGNGKDACPLAGCAAGRFRNVGGLMFDDRGQELDLDTDGVLRHGPRHSLSEIDTNMVGGRMLEFEVFEKKNESPPRTGPPRTIGHHVTATELVDFLGEMLVRNLKPKQLDRIPGGFGVKVFDSFQGPSVKASGPPKFQTEKAAKPPSVTLEQVELEKYLANGKDPRL